MNIWKIVTILLVLLFIGLTIFLYQQQTEEVDLKLFKLKKVDFDALLKATDQPRIQICEMESKQCVTLQKVEG